MILGDILYAPDIISANADSGAYVKDVANNSLNAVKNTVFFALKGENDDGYGHIKEAVKNGCKAVVCEKIPDIIIPYILVKNAHRAYAYASSALYSHPVRKLKGIAVTGTNGKTTTTTMLHHILTDIYGEKSTLLIGGVSNIVCGDIREASQTTPDPKIIYSLCAEAVGRGAEYFVTEASSHALDDDKLFPCRFEAGAMTNLTEDHLDRHKTLENYFEAKKKLIPLCKNFIANGDDVFTKTVECKKFSLLSGDFTAKITALNQNGSEFEYRGIKDAKVKIKTPGKFNVYNALVAIALSELLNIDANDAAEALSGFTGAPGRFESILCKNGQTVIIDYAHTPDALENALLTSKAFCKRKLICVFGCGGDRDKNKRKIMGAISTKYADFTVITSDNSRSEEPFDIIKDILEGVNKESRYTVIEDRKSAILYALEKSGEGDVILLAGKGHENYEIDKNGKRYFSEKDIINEYNSKSE